MTTTAIIITQSHNIYSLCLENNLTILLTGRVSGKMMHTASSPADYPAVGDHVLIDWDGHGSNAVIHEVLPRRSVLDRVGDPSTGVRQIIAANLDVLVLCMSLNQNFSLNRAERYVTAALAGNVTPVIVLTKADLCNAADAFAEQTRAAFPAAQVRLNSTPDMPAAIFLRDLLREGKTLAFAGSSGVGKSTLVNAVLGEETMRTSTIREADGRGRHTTTHRELIFTPWGGAVIDTPGMRAFALDDADVDSLFINLAELAVQCRFSDCRHQTEPGCAICRALEEGVVTKRQVDSFIRLTQERDQRSKFIKRRSKR